MANQENTKFKIVSKVSDPPTLTAAEIEQIQQESQHLREAFSARAASMERLTADDLKIRLK